MREAKMNRAKWIWYYNDYAIYHSMLLHCRRQELGCDYPCVWYVPRPELNATFQKKNVVIEQDTVLRCVTHGKGKMHINHVPYPVNKDIPLSKGTYDFYINIYDLDLFPAIFIDNEFVSTDESWEAYSIQDEWLPVGCEPAYTEANADLSVFPFCYEEQSAIAAELLNGGVLYDYGKETFAVVRLKSNRNLNGLRIVYGESKEEALDEKNAIVRDTVEEDRTEITYG
ncbi:MAG TPA: hypothetical protein DDY98_01340, partial [Ruminococcaceae bacterium]|nr:hypothetical protein [Oscillospiraceae bacterium]